MNSTPITLSTQHLSVGYRNGKQTITLLHDLNLTLQQGQLVAMLGQNGAGKSTLLRTLTCDLPPIEGSIAIQNTDIAQLKPRERARLLSLVSTERIQAGALTVTELVGLGRQPHTGFLGRLNHEDRQIIDQAMTDAGIAHKANSYVADLSDGERQKAMIAKALAQQTPIIILDEPTAFLDVASRIETMRLLQTLAHDQDKTILLSSHDVSQSLMLADALWLITSQREVLTGTPQSLIDEGAMNCLFDNPAIHFNPQLLDFTF